MARFAFAVLLLLLGPTPHALAKKHKPVACPAGRFLADELQLQGSAMGALAIDASGHVSLDGCGPATHAKRQATARFTRVRATWAKCGTLARVLVVGKIAAPDCGTLTGVVRAKKVKPKPFSADRSTCGDGTIDAGGGEQCDPGDDASPCPCGAVGTMAACQCITTTTTTLPPGPIVAPQGQWTWVDFPDSSCDDGSPTGIGVNLASSPNVLVFLNGGGACWDYQTCFVLNTAVHGPFGKTQFDASQGTVTGSILDRNLAGNPFADWNLVYVPYCTGDVHAGDNVIVYQSGGISRTVHHVGHANVVAYLRRLVPTFPTVGKLVVSGSSAGGFGALSDYADFRDHWPTAKVYLLDDSGPPLESSAYSSALRDAWTSSWRLDKLVDPICGAPCLADFSQAIPALVQRYPNDRLALLESEQDGVVRFFYSLDGPGFQAALLAMATDRIDPHPTFHYFFIPGASHTMLGNPSGFSQNSTGLLTWITQLVTDDPAWASIKP